MLVTTAFLAFLASPTAYPFPPLGIALPTEAATAVGSCLEAASPGAVDEARLIADGWQKKKPAEWPSGNVFTRRGNSAILFTMDAPLSGTCFVRVRLADDASVHATGLAIDGLLGVTGERRARTRQIYWRKGNRIVGSSAFDDGPGYPPHVIQIVIGELPKEIR